MLNRSPVLLSSVFIAATSTTIWSPVIGVDGDAPSPASSDDNRPVLTPKSAKQFDQGKSAFASGQYGQAKTEFEKLLKMAPANPEINFLLGVTKQTCQTFNAF